MLFIASKKGAGKEREIPEMSVPQLIKYWGYPIGKVSILYKDNSTQYAKILNPYYVELFPTFFTGKIKESAPS